LLSAERSGISRRLATIRAVALQCASLRVVHEINCQDRIPEVTFEPRVLDGKEHFDAPVQIAIHQIGAPQVDLLRTAVGEVVDPAMLQESPDDAPAPNRLAHTWNPWAQAAHATNDQVCLYAGLGGTVQRRDDVLIGQSVALEDKPTVSRLTLAGDFALDLLQQCGAKAMRRHEQFTVLSLVAIPSEDIEQLTDISGDGLICGEQPQVDVGECSASMVVARAQMDIATDDII